MFLQRDLECGCWGIGSGGMWGGATPTHGAKLQSCLCFSYFCALGKQVSLLRAPSFSSDYRNTMKSCYWCVCKAMIRNLDYWVQRSSCKSDREWRTGMAQRKDWNTVAKTWDRRKLLLPCFHEFLASPTLEFPDCCSHAHTCTHAHMCTYTTHPGHHTHCIP